MPRIEDNIAAVVEAIGTEHVGLVWGLGSYSWPNAEERDAFLNAITKPMEG